MVKHVDHLPDDSQKHPLLFLLPVALARLGEVTKVLSLARRAIHKFLVSVHAVVSPSLLATIIAVKHKTTVLQNCVLVSVGKDLKALSQTLQCQTFSVSFVLFLCASPAPSSSQTSSHSICREILKTVLDN